MSVCGQILNSAANTPDLLRRRMQGLHADRDFVLTLQPQHYPFAALHQRLRGTGAGSRSHVGPA
jgi:hypothetical protein